MAADCGIVGEWLRSVGHAQYACAFIDNGYDDLEICKVIGEPDLDAIGVTCHDHRLALLTAVTSLRQHGGARVYAALDNGIVIDDDDKPEVEWSSDGEGRLVYAAGRRALVTFPKLQLLTICRDRLQERGVDFRRGKQELEGVCRELSLELNTHIAHVREALATLRGLKPPPAGSKLLASSDLPTPLHTTPPPLPTCLPPCLPVTKSSPGTLTKLQNRAQRSATDDGCQKLSPMTRFLRSMTLRRSRRKESVDGAARTLSNHSAAPVKSSSLSFLKLTSLRRKTDRLPTDSSRARSEPTEIRQRTLGGQDLLAYKRTSNDHHIHNRDQLRHNVDHIRHDADQLRHDADLVWRDERSRQLLQHVSPMQLRRHLPRMGLSVEAGRCRPCPARHLASPLTLRPAPLPPTHPLPGHRFHSRSYEELSRLKAILDDARDSPSHSSSKHGGAFCCATKEPSVIGYQSVPYRAAVNAAFINGTGTPPSRPLSPSHGLPPLIKPPPFSSQASSRPHTPPCTTQLRGHYPPTLHSRSYSTTRSHYDNDTACIWVPAPSDTPPSHHSPPSAPRAARPLVPPRTVSLLPLAASTSPSSCDMSSSDELSDTDRKTHLGLNQVVSYDQCHTPHSGSNPVSPSMHQNITPRQDRDDILRKNTPTFHQTNSSFSQNQQPHLPHNSNHETQCLKHEHGGENTFQGDSLYPDFSENTSKPTSISQTAPCKKSCMSVTVDRV